MKSLIWTLCFVVLLNGLGIAQATNPPSQKKPIKPVSKPEVPELPLQQRRAIGLLDSLVKETIAIDDQPLRINVQAKIADALWQYNQPRAREIFIEAFDAIEAIEFPPTKIPWQVSDDDEYIEYSERFGLRSQILTLVAAHDLGLADKLRSSIAERSAAKNSATDQKKAQREQTLQLLWLARALAKSDPAKAAQLVRQSFKSGFEPMVGPILNELHPVNPELANKLFLEALPIARNRSGALSKGIGVLAYCFSSDLDRFLGRDWQSDSRQTLVQPFLSATLDVISRQVATESEGTAVITGQMAEEEYWLLLQQLTPLFTKRMPDALPTVQLRTVQLTKHLPTKEAETIQKQLTNDSEAYLKEAEAATNPRQKDVLYMRAASRAVAQGKSDEAIRIAEKIQDREERYLMGSVVRYQIAMKAVNKDAIDEALRYAREIEFSPQRISIYQKVAEKFLSKKDYQHTSELLSEIERWLEASAEDPKKAKGLLDVAGLVSSFDSIRGFEVTKLAVKAINNTEFKPPASQRESPIKIGGLDFARPFASLARADFERALLIAQSIQKKEAAIIAQVEICKAALVGTQSKKP